MGQGVLSRLRVRKEINVLILGLDSVGKTTLLYKLQGDVSIVIPTIGMTVKSAYCKNFHITAWDVGGRDKIRALYVLYYRLMDVVLFMVDSADRDRLEMAGEELRRLAEEPELKHVPLVLLANKQDLPDVMNVERVADVMRLEETRRHRLIEIFPTSGLTGEGVPEVLEWIDHQLKRKQMQEMLVQPAKKAVPPSLTSLCASVSSALKQTLGTVKGKLIW